MSTSGSNGGRGFHPRPARVDVHPIPLAQADAEAHRMVRLFRFFYALGFADQVLDFALPPTDSQSKED